MFVIPVSFFKSHPEFVSALSSALSSNSVFYAYDSDIEVLDLEEKDVLSDFIFLLGGSHES